MEQYVLDHGSSSLEELCQHFSVSMNTVRRDIADLTIERDRAMPRPPALIKRQRLQSCGFWPRAAALLSDLVLGDVGRRTASEALDAGVAPREVWLALCAANDVPDERRYGVGRREPRRS